MRRSIGIMRIFRSAIILALPLFVLTSCEVEEVEFVQLTKVEVKDVKPKQITFDVTAILNNPNGFAINVVGSDLDLYLQGNKMGKATLLGDLKIESNTQKAYDLIIRTDGDNLQTRLLPIMFTAALTGQVTTRLDGTITGKVSFIKREVDVDITEEVKFKSES